MTNLPTKDDLRRETRDWLKNGVIPAKAAAARRHMAEAIPNLADWHEAFAAEWDRIEETQPEKVIAAYEAVLQYEIKCLSRQTPGSAAAIYWQDRAAETDRTLIGLDPKRVR